MEPQHKSQWSHQQQEQRSQFPQTSQDLEPPPMPPPPPFYVESRSQSHSISPERSSSGRHTPSDGHAPSSYHTPSDRRVSSDGRTPSGLPTPSGHHAPSPLSSRSSPSDSHIYVLGIPMHTLSRPAQFLLCFSGVVFFYLLYGYSQEWIFQDKTFKQYGWYLTFVQFAFYTVFGLTERTLRGEWQRRIPLSTYLLIGFLTVATMGLSNTSLGYLNYPTQVIFKSCKLIPVMIGGVLIQGKKYTVLNVVAMLFMCVGLVLFNLADVSVSPNMDHTGILLISLALCADAVIGNVQEKAMKTHSASSLEVVFYSYSIGMVYIFFLILVSGTIVAPFKYCLENPRIYMMASIFSLTGYLGVNFVLALVKTFGALVAVTVTTFRKTITVVLSFLLFTKPFSQQYIWSGLLVLLGIFLNVYSKNPKSFDLPTIKTKLTHLLLEGSKVIWSLKQFRLSALKSMRYEDGGFTAGDPVPAAVKVERPPPLEPDSSLPRSTSVRTFLQNKNEAGIQPVEVKITS